MPASVRTALARLLEFRTQATLQEQFVADVIQQEVDKLNGVGSSYNLPQIRSPFLTKAYASKKQSRYKGVTKTSHGKWNVKICRQGIVTELGTYNEELEAAIVYQAAEAEYNKLKLTSKRGGRKKGSRNLLPRPEKLARLDIDGGPTYHHVPS